MKSKSFSSFENDDFDFIRFMICSAVNRPDDCQSRHEEGKQANNDDFILNLLSYISQVYLLQNEHKTEHEVGQEKHMYTVDNSYSAMIYKNHTQTTHKHQKLALNSIISETFLAMLIEERKETKEKRAFSFGILMENF